MENEEKLNRVMLIKYFIRHETLTVRDLLKEGNMEERSGEGQLNFLLDELADAGLLKRLNGVEPVTYTITSTGITEGHRYMKSGIVR